MANTKRQSDLLLTALKRFDKLETEDNHNRNSARSDLRFTYNIDEGQWPEALRNERNSEDRPCLTSNKLRKFVAQVANREREQRLAGNVRPVDDKGDPAVAKVLSGMIRQIEHASRASKIYTRAGEHAIAAGFGYWRITSEELDDSFDQELFIRPIKNQFSVRLDPDRMYGFIRDKVSVEEFKYQYPKATEESFASGTSLSDAEWYDGEYVFVAEYFYKERVRTEIVQAKHPLTGEISVFEIDEEKGVTDEALQMQGWQVINRKTPKAYKVKWAKITASQVLEEGEWAGKEIPIIEVEGDWINYDGKEYKRSLITDAKDDQRMYNYWKTYMTETVALSIKSPYLVTLSMIKGLGKFWNVAHKKLLPYLPFKPQGNLVPRREPPPQIPTGGAAMLDISGRDINDTIGVYNSFFGEKSNERTGVAIQARANRSDFGTFHFQDNFRYAILECTRQLIDLIPKIYDSQRWVRILGEENQTEGEGVSGGEQPAMPGQDSIVQVNVTDPISGFKYMDLSLGKYDMVEDVKIMSTRRQEALQGMIELASGSPQLAMILAPRIAEMQDWPNAKLVEQDIKAALPAMLGIQPQQGGEPAPGGTQGLGG